jgi:hypothetical protein
VLLLVLLVLVLLLVVGSCRRYRRHVLLLLLCVEWGGESVCDTWQWLPVKLACCLLFVVVWWDVVRGLLCMCYLCFGIVEKPSNLACHVQAALLLLTVLFSVRV